MIHLAIVRMTRIKTSRSFILRPRTMAVTPCMECAIARTYPHTPEVRAIAFVFCAYGE